jgi:putative chitobiose transport system permease protein
MIKPKISTETINAYGFLFPALLILGITVLWPALWAFYLSFTSYNQITQVSEWVGFNNFQRLWSDEIFWQTVNNTFWYLVIVVPILVVLPLLLAIFVNQKLSGISWFRGAYYVPVIISMVVAGIAWKFIYGETGILNQLLKLVGINYSIPWLTDPKWALFSVMVVTIWKGLGYYMVVYLAGLQSIPSDLYEAAAIDGSDRYTKHWDITLPLMKSYMMLVAVISAISATKVFEEIYVMTQGGPRNSSKTIVYYLYEKSFQGDLDISYGCTIGLLLFMVILILSVINVKLSGGKINV